LKVCKQKITTINSVLIVKTLIAKFKGTSVPII